MATDQVTALPNLFRLDGKTALITGASEGLGFEMARGLAAYGAKVIVHGRNAEKVYAAVSKIDGAIPALFDLRDRDGMNSEIDRLLAEVKRIDILVCNAGQRDRREFLTTSRDTLEELLEVNLSANFELAHRLVPAMIEAKAGRILFVTSIAALQGTGRGPTYSASKGGLAAMARALAVELGEHNICVNCLAPGFFATEYNVPATQTPATIERMNKRVPLKRWGKPEEIIGAALLLASDAGSYITGQTLLLDGGMSICA